MSEKNAWDLTSTHSLTGAAEWIRKRASVAGNRALVVVVIRDEAPGLMEMLTRQRMGKTG